jgi:photosystem II stability/assembly factor-like uncharacterized protein
MNTHKVLALGLLLSGLGTSAQEPKATPYTWKGVQIVGGGFVDGVIFHPAAKGVRYARTDVGGAYRWDAIAHRWQPMLDWMPYKDLNLMGIESIAVDPADPSRVYLACGTYTNPNTPNGAILRSNDRGRTFERTDVPFKFGGNEDGRGNGERLVVDPNDGRVLYLGTRHDGLWRSADRGATWAKVAGFPDIAEKIVTPDPIPGETQQQRYQHMPVRGDGIVFIKFGSAAGNTTQNRPTQTIYAGVSLMHRPNLFVSTDGGESWHESAGEPTKYRPTRAALSSDGYLYVTYGTSPGPSRMVDGAVWKLDTHSGAWTDITPDEPIAGSKEFGYAAVSVDAQHPQTLIASSFGRPKSAGGEDIFRSTDGGATWKQIFRGGNQGGGIYDYALAPYVKSTPIHWLFDIEIDPLNSNHATFTTGYGGWETFDLTAVDRNLPTHWSILATGIEETVALGLDSPTKGADLITAIGDYGGFVHWNLDRPAPEGSSAPPRFGNTTGVASSLLRPEVVVRVGVTAGGQANANLGYSLDKGRTWKASSATPTADSRSGSIAISADAAIWVWTPERAPAFLTRDHGDTWAAVQGLPAGVRVVADPIDPQSFYAMSLRDGTLFRSTDGAASFNGHSFALSDGPLVLGASSRGDNRGGQDRLYAAPGRTGDLWLAAFNGLYHDLASPTGLAAVITSFSRVARVDEVHAFGFGKSAPHKSYPTMYLVGTVQGQRGIFRSIDAGVTWVRINDDMHQWGLILQITGDPKRFARVYVGTHGRGISYGDPR